MELQETSGHISAVSMDNAIERTERDNAIEQTERCGRFIPAHRAMRTLNSCTHDTLLFAEIHPPVVERTTDFLLRKKVVWYTGG